MKLFFLVLTLYFYLTINAFGEIEISDFKDYEITKTKFQLETISENLKYPWGMTFIDDETLLITEKKGGEGAFRELANLIFKAHNIQLKY